MSGKITLACGGHIGAASRRRPRRFGVFSCFAELAHILAACGLVQGGKKCHAYSNSHNLVYAIVYK